MNYRRTFAAGGMALMLVISATGARAQTTPSSSLGSRFGADPDADPMTLGALGSPAGQFANNSLLTTDPDAGVGIPRPPDAFSNPPPGFDFQAASGPVFNPSAPPAFPTAGFPAIGGPLPSFGRR